jgi:hypothetical protein
MAAPIRRLPPQPRHGRPIERAGFTITTLEQFFFRAARTPVSFQIAEHATAPGP